jgi:hypothetical protein
METGNEFMGFVEDHASQRRRLVTAQTKEGLQQEIQRVEERWRNEILYSKFDDSLGAWKRETLHKNTLTFPDLPKPPDQVEYQSIFSPLQFSVGSPHKVHLDDYSQFYSFIRNAAAYRLEERISKLLGYPAPKPEMRIFPNGIKKLALKKVKHLLLYLLFWELPKWQQLKRYNEWLATVAEDRHLYWESRKDAFDRAVRDCLDHWQESKSEWDTQLACDRAKWFKLRSQYETGNSKGIIGYFVAQLDSVPLPRWCPHEYELQFDEAQGVLLIECRLPYLGSLEFVKSKKLASGFKQVPANQKEARDLSNYLPYLIALRLMWEVPKVDYYRKVSTVCCNGFVVYDDPATGQHRRDVILSVAASREELETIRLDRVEPEACFRNLKGVAAAKIWEMVPIQPLIQFNKNDSRFILAKAVLDTLGDENLATMDWQEFEHLIRELFEKEFGTGGAEVKVTQASRDRGVDAIVFDPDPLRGGKFIIQAKRYTNTVDVSAVRDLYGTVINEGASRGILVTTSNYGRDTYDFAKDKPLTLMNGQHLLHLLNKHGYKLRIDLKEAKQLRPPKSENNV